MLGRYLIGGATLSEGSDAFSQALELAHANQVRPLCLCRLPGIPMCVVKGGSKFFVRCMPNTGPSHAPACESYEPPAELSGLGQVIGSAVLEDPERGVTTLRLDFPLTKISGRAKPMSVGIESGSVKSDASKLTLRATLHFFWEQAGFNRWTPGMKGKRNWAVIRRHLLLAAERMNSKGTSLAGVLYVPEPFYVEQKDTIAARRSAYFAKVCNASKSGGQKLMLLIAEVKEILPARYGKKLIFKHAPDLPFLVSEDLSNRLPARFEVELSLWNSIADSHLIAIATVSVSVTGTSTVEEISFMAVTSAWVPFESTYDKLLIDAMCTNGRRFSKGLRYNLPAARPLACLIASDTISPTAMYIEVPGAAQEVSDGLRALINESTLPYWVWKVSDGSLPELPPLATSLEMTTNRPHD